ncbi:polysaccharide deacetylase family protein [Kyrpidia tusciae]|nr:polysaccharide deacetylase family protein [Kyrpidia tusciae]
MELEQHSGKTNQNLIPDLRGVRIDMNKHILPYGVAGLVFAVFLALIVLVGVIFLHQSEPHHVLITPTTPSLSAASTDNEPIRRSDYLGKSRYHYRNRVLVLMYHHIDPHEGAFTISPERFAAQMNALQQAGYHIIGLNKLLAFADSGAPVPDNAVVITFDDGYESFYKYAYPILRAHHYPATNFIIVQDTDAPNLNRKAIPHLTWLEMRKMQHDGMTFCNHTYNLHYLAVVDATGHQKPAAANAIFLPGKGRKETQQEYEARIRSDLALAEERLERELGPHPKALAFPYGAYNDTVLNVARSLGIRLFFTVKPGINPPDRTLLYRINAGTTALSAQGLLNVLRHYDQPTLTPTGSNM